MMHWHEWYRPYHDKMADAACGRAKGPILAEEQLKVDLEIV